MRPPLLCLALLIAGCSRAEAPAEAQTGRAPETAAARTQAAAGAPVAPAVRTFQAWEAACDNTRRCTLFGFPDADGDPDKVGWGFIRLERSAEADAAPAITFSAGERLTDAQPRTLPMTVSVDGRPATTLTARAGDEAPYYAGRLEGAQAQAAAAALRTGRRLSTLR